MADGPASGSFPQAPAAPSLVGTVLDGRYRITKLIGEGGMGEVFAAEHVHIEKKFAIKLLKQEIVSNAEAVQRFRQEARSSSSIGHRNIIAIEDFGQLPDGRIYMCMELLNGAALNDMITQPIAPDRLLNILIQTGHGLAAAHAKGIVHRDMKPENIFVTIAPNGEDVPKILDFGIAKVSGNDGQNHLTRTGTIFGTPFYMAPEQALGNPVDARTDIYAMGVIMYECFAGSLPFSGESFMGILTQHITTEPEPVAQRAAKAGRQLPIGLAEIITRCMQKNPAQRYATMDELVNALISVYRGIAGPGMSTYMEAFPVGSAQHMAQPTPAPMQPGQLGAMATPQAATIAAGGPSGGYGMPHSTPMPGGPPMGAIANQSGLYSPSSASSSYVAPKKSNMGLIIAILAVIVVGGGVAAFVLLNNDQTKTAQSGSGSTAGSDQGSQIVATGSGGSAATGSAATGSAGSAVVATGSNAGSAGSAATGSAGSAVEPAAKRLHVLVMTAPYTPFEAWDSGKKVDDGPVDLVVTEGTPRTIVIKARGFKEKTVVVDGTKKKVTVKLDRIPGQSHPTNVVQTPKPGHPDCSATLKDPGDKNCQAQFCGTHADAPACQIEN
ncbi:MAG: serine/threonine protein kinase [Acidobacteriota bacterium]